MMNNYNDDHYLSENANRLTHQQQRFCDLYLTHYNAFKAAVEAGYSENTSRKGALLHVPKIQWYLKEKMADRSHRLEITHDMILRELAKVAFANMGNYYDEYACLKRIKDLTVDEKAAIAYYDFVEIQDGEGYRVGTQSRIKLHNKMSALDKIARHLGFYGVAARNQDGLKSKEQGARTVSGERGVDGRLPNTPLTPLQRVTDAGVRESAVIDRSVANLPMDYPVREYAYGEERDELEGIDLETLAALEDVNISPGQAWRDVEDEDGAKSKEQGSKTDGENVENFLQFPPWRESKS
jgi:hypothetical protein